MMKEFRNVDNVFYQKWEEILKNINSFEEIKNSSLVSVIFAWKNYCFLLIIIKLIYFN